MRYGTVIGLEVHIELLTETKIFCSCPTEFGGEPNTHVCPVCLGLPGTLPTLNKKAVELSVRAGLAAGCEITPISRFDRKIIFTPTCRRLIRYPSYICRCAETAQSRSIAAKLYA